MLYKWNPKKRKHCQHICSDGTNLALCAVDHRGTIAYIYSETPAIDRAVCTNCASLQERGLTIERLKTGGDHEKRVHT